MPSLPSHGSTTSFPNSRLSVSLCLSSTYPLVSFLFLPKSLTSCRAISISKPPIHRSLPDADIFRRVDRYVATPLRLSLSLFLGTEPAPEGSTVASKIDVETPARVVVFRLCSLFPPPSIRPCPLAANSKYSGRKPWR